MSQKWSNKPFESSPIWSHFGYYETDFLLLSWIKNKHLTNKLQISSRSLNQLFFRHLHFFTHDIFYRKYFLLAFSAIANAGTFEPATDRSRLQKLVIETDKGVGSPMLFVYWFGLQNMQCHICCRAIKTTIIKVSVIVLWWGGGQVVIVLAFYSNGLSSNLAEVSNFTVRLLSNGTK